MTHSCGQTVVVLAAGFGRRFGGLKQLIPFGPKRQTLMKYSLISARDHGYERAVCIIRRETCQALAAALGDLCRSMEITFVHQSLDDVPDNVAIAIGRIEPWGSAHAIYVARKHINGPFTVINADDFYGTDAWEAMAAMTDEQPNAAAMVSYQLGNTLSPNGPVSRGICQFHGDDLRSIVECKKIIRDGNGGIVSRITGQSFREDTPVSMNFWHFPGDFFPFLARDWVHFFSSIEDPLNDEWTLPGAVNRWIGEGASVRAVTCSAVWCGITHPADRDWVEKVLGKQK